MDTTTMRFRDVEYMNVTLGPGDCIFMPYSTLHYVNTHEEEAKTDPHVFQARGATLARCRAIHLHTCSGIRRSRIYMF